MASQQHAAAQLAAAAVGGHPAGAGGVTGGQALVERPVVAHRPCAADAEQQQHWGAEGGGCLGAGRGLLSHLASHAGSRRAAGGVVLREGGAQGGPGLDPEAAKCNWLQLTADIVEPIYVCWYARGAK